MFYFYHCALVGRMRFRTANGNPRDLGPRERRVLSGSANILGIFRVKEISWIIFFKYTHVTIVADIYWVYIYFHYRYIAQDILRAQLEFPFRDCYAYFIETSSRERERERRRLSNLHVRKYFEKIDLYILKRSGRFSTRPADFRCRAE